jgi:predicted metalloprotease with PDZ domain
MEGITSYYGERTLLLSGLWTAERYLRHLATEIQTLEGLPARQHLSLAQASFDGWLGDPAQMHDYGNAWFSFYNKGEVVAVLLDLAIRRATSGERSLDDVMRILWEEYGRSGRGLEEDGFERAVARVADVGDFFVRYVEGTEPLPYAELFAAAGVAFASTPREPEVAVLAARLKQDGGRLVMESAVRRGAAMDAGLLPGDELLALGETRIGTEAALTAALRGMRIGESAELLIARAGVIRRLSLQARPDPRPAISLQVEGTSELRRGWLRSEE